MLISNGTVVRLVDVSLPFPKKFPYRIILHRFFTVSLPLPSPFPYRFHQRCFSVSSKKYSNTCCSFWPKLGVRFLCQFESDIVKGQPLAAEVLHPASSQWRVPMVMRMQMLPLLRNLCRALQRTLRLLKTMHHRRHLARPQLLHRVLMDMCLTANGVSSSLIAKSGWLRGGCWAHSSVMK